MLNLEYLAELARMNQDALDARVQEFSIGGKAFAFNSRSHIMGVINLSSDSWYRESVCLSTDVAVARAKVLNAQGADIVDIGAESTLAWLVSLMTVMDLNRTRSVEAKAERDKADGNGVPGHSEVVKERA